MEAVAVEAAAKITAHTSYRRRRDSTTVCKGRLFKEVQYPICSITADLPFTTMKSRNNNNNNGMFDLRFLPTTTPCCTLNNGNNVTERFPIREVRKCRLEILFNGVEAAAVEGVNNKFNNRARCPMALCGQPKSVQDKHSRNNNNSRRKKNLSIASRCRR